MKKYALLMILAAGLVACGEEVNENAVVEPTAEELQAINAEADAAEAETASLNDFIEKAEMESAELDSALNDLDF